MQLDALDMATAASINVPGFITRGNTILHKPAGSDAEWLTGDEIIALASADNPDGADTSPAWLSGPGPINFWHTHFQRTLHDANEAGRTHIMVVNTQNAYGLKDTFSGMHWFLVAWKVDGARMIDPHGESP